MPMIVMVHGVGHQFDGEDILHAEWLPALRSGLRRAGKDLPEPDDLACPFYGDLFRERSTKPIGLPDYRASDVVDRWEQDLLKEWWHAAARMERQVSGPGINTKLRTPSTVQRALAALSTSRFFAGIAERALIADLRQL